jgi:hypothetical protein
MDIGTIVTIIALSAAALLILSLLFLGLRFAKLLIGIIKYALILIGGAAFAAVWIISMPVWLPIRIARRRKGG